MGVAFGVVLGSEGSVAGLVAAVSSFLVGYSGFVVLMAGFLIGYFRLEWYVVDVGGTLWQLGRARRRPRQARELLRGSPIYWREPIWLPLIGLKGLLRSVAEQDYRAGVEECLFVISERPTQGRAARSVLMGMMADHLGELGTVREIASSAEELGRARTERGRLPAVLGEALAGLCELVGDAEQHLTATLPHNRRRALEKLRGGADSLARELALGGGELATMWAGVANKWREVAEARLAEMEEAEEGAGFVPNPFVFGQPIEETETNLFVGRREVVRKIEVSLLGVSQKPALVLWGPRRMGKTSVLLQLPRLLGEEFASAFVDMQAMQVRESVSAFFHSVTEAGAASLRRRGVEARGIAAADLVESPFSSFAEWMEEVEERLGDGRYLLLCLDEFERLERSIQEGRLPGELMDQIRHIIQHHPRIVLLFAGSHRPDEMELDWPDALISAKMIEVGYLTAEETRRLVTQPVPDFAVTYATGSIERIVELTRGQPYLVQALCFELVNHLNVVGRREARREDVTEAMAQALESAHLYFAEMSRQLSDSQNGLLGAIAEAGEGATVGELASKRGGSAEQVEADLKTLEMRSIVERAEEGERWRFQVPMVGEWVKRQG